jgi:hypothetical protein
MIDPASVYKYIHTNSVRIVQIAFIVILIFTIIMMSIEGTSPAGAYTSLTVLLLSGIIGLVTSYIGSGDGSIPTSLNFSRSTPATL